MRLSSSGKGKIQDVNQAGYLEMYTIRLKRFVKAEEA